MKKNKNHKLSANHPEYEAQQILIKTKSQDNPVVILGKCKSIK